jgi:hypothetical protein
LQQYYTVYLNSVAQPGEEEGCKPSQNFSETYSSITYVLILCIFIIITYNLSRNCFLVAPLFKLEINIQKSFLWMIESFQISKQHNKLWKIIFLFKEIEDVPTNDNGVRSQERLSNLTILQLQYKFWSSNWWIKRTLF